jgi:hypothetical protein
MECTPIYEAAFFIQVTEDQYNLQKTRAFYQSKLDEFTKIKQSDTSYTMVPFGTNGDYFKNAQDKNRNVSRE